MRWRRVPPVHSPIAPRSLIGASAAALGLSDRKTEALERQLSRTFDAHEALLTDSGTSALVLALEAAVAPGGTVAMPGYACIDIIAAAIRARVQVVLYDLDPDTMSPDLESVRTTLRDGARALVVTPLYGYPVDMPALAELAAAHGVPVIEDAAQGAGGLLHSRRLGAFGDLAVLSFGRGKGTTGGSGGTLLIRHPSFLDWARTARGRLPTGARGARDIVALGAQWLLARPLLYSIPSNIPALKLGEMIYHAASEPRALSAAAATVLHSALALDPEEVRARRARARDLLAAAPRSRRFTPIRPLEGADPGYLRLAMLDTTGTAVANPYLGAVRGYPITLDEHAQTQRVIARAPQTLSGARVLRDRLFTLPTHSRFSDRDAARLRDWIGSEAAHRLLHLGANAAV